MLRKLRMQRRWLLIVVLFSLPFPLLAQSGTSVPFQLYGSFSRLSNSFDGVPGARHPLDGMNAGMAFPAWHNLRFRIDYSRYGGTDLGASQRAYFLMGGVQYERWLHREGLFAEALFGEGGLNRNWGAHAAPGATASFAVLLGGGLDTRVSRHFGVRVEGGLQHTNFDLIQSIPNPVPYKIPGLPNYFGRFSSGIVWAPRVVPRPIQSAIGITRSEPVESELIIEDQGSFGHYHVFAYTWWSYLYTAGVEYDRHSWGNFIGAQVDYVAEILPIAILRQPARTDVFGDPLSTRHTTVEGLGISPIGMRLIWRSERAWKPYYLIKAGMIGFTHKALSQEGSYENFSLQQSIGIQFRLNDRWDFRAGFADFHFSNAFIVPNNPGIDEMEYSGGLSYHLHRRHSTF